MKVEALAASDASVGIGGHPIAKISAKKTPYFQRNKGFIN